MSGRFSIQEPALPLFDPIQKEVLPLYAKDHRKRLRERFINGGAAALPDYELLELVLFRVLDRKNVKPLAHALIKAFGDFSGVISAPKARLIEVDGVGDAVATELKIVEAAAHRLAQSRILQRHVISSWDDLIGYCRAAMGHLCKEQFRVMFLDTKNRLIADEALANGTVNHVPVYPREVMKRALELDASAIILVHNHPSGDATPSDGDIVMTQNVESAAKALSITLHDHLVIGNASEFSFRANGLI